MLTVEELRAVVYGLFDNASDVESIGPFGPIFTGYTNRPEAAIKKLMQEKRGEIVDAFIHPKLGKIAFVYGNEKFGLRHIEARRGMPWINQVPRILRKGRVAQDPQGFKRVYLIEEIIPTRNVAVIRLEWDGMQRTWLMTAFPDDEGKWNGADKTTGTVEQQRIGARKYPSQSSPSQSNGTTPTLSRKKEQ